MAKKKKVAKSKNTNFLSSVEDVTMGKDFESVAQGDCFIYNKKLCMKLNQDGGDQYAVGLSNGELLGCMCGELVIPVYVEIDFEGISS